MYPQTNEWSMKGKVLELVHGERSANVELEDGDTRLFMRSDVRLDTTRKYQEDEEEDLNSQLAGTGLEARKDQELEDTRKRPRRARQAPNVDPGGAKEELKAGQEEGDLGG